MSATAVRSAAPAAPFKGLANYTEQDSAIFFGREREREVIMANLKARRLTVLYGNSGVGKSSLLRAGVASRLLEHAHRNHEDLGTPEFVPVVFSAWRDDPVSGLQQAIAAAVAPFASASWSPSMQGPLAAAIDAAATASDAYLLIILDQFEEYFLYHAGDDRPGCFAEQFAGAVGRRGLQASFLVSIREDALAKLDRFKATIPKLFDSSLRFSHLDARAAREAILRPIEHYNGLVEPEARVTLEPALVDEVLAQVRTGEVVLEQSGHGALQGAEADAGADDQIETPYLQLVMTRLWQAERQHGSSELRLATLTQLGGAQEIVRTHLDAALSSLSAPERDVAADLFHHLVTPSGTKIAHMAGDLAEYTQHAVAEVEAMLATLASAEIRILRPVRPPPGEQRPPRFEIFHDVLAASVLDWRTRHNAERAVVQQLQARRAVRRRRLVRVVSATTLLAVLVAGFVVYDRRDRAARDADDALREFERFNPSLSLATSSSPHGVRVKKLTVSGQRGTRFSVACTGTPCSAAPAVIAADGRPVEINAVRNHVLARGSQLRVYADRNGFAEYLRFRVSRTTIPKPVRAEPKRGCLARGARPPAPLLRPSPESGCLNVRGES